MSQGDAYAAAGDNVYTATTYYSLNIVGSPISNRVLTEPADGSLSLQKNSTTSTGNALPTLTDIASLSEITSATGSYRLTADIISTTDRPGVDNFSGFLDGDGHTVKSLDAPLFKQLSSATVCNLTILSATISTSGMAGAIAEEATGSSRIYNCGVQGGTIGGSGYTGGIVGKLDGYSRVINCYSYANITGGTSVGGIVGYNNYASKSNDMRTMVMNCIFYGDITGGTSKAPIYNGQNITNDGASNGVNNYNYFLAEAPYVKANDIQVYNCALTAETRFLQRWEFFRYLLNSNRELAAYYATGSVSEAGQMMKWVLLPDSLGTDHPYPILRPWRKYPSVVNPDAANAPDDAERNQGGKVGTLTVNIQAGTGGAVYAAPSGASITNATVTLNITDKDTAHYNFNYGKVQLPYYNDVAEGNYTENRVVTGWKIVSVTGGTEGSFTTGDDVEFNSDGTIKSTPYNFADRTTYAKDLYAKSGRVFNQGAYWEVPDGVTAITIEPYWAKAAYFADDYRDVVFKNTMSDKVMVTALGDGRRLTNNTTQTINGSYQKVFSEIGNAVKDGLYGGVSDYKNHTVYDYAAVLIGNYHLVNGVEGSADKPYTVMSVDLDRDNEPDYCFIRRFNKRVTVHPVRYDFVNLMGLGMAQKTTGKEGTYNFGILLPVGWFEVTNTALFRVTQFEYDQTNRKASPIIVQGGYIEQWVSGQDKGCSNKTTYFHVGGNAWFKEFHIGCHQDKNYPSKHVPISVTGGDYDEFYLTGAYKADVDVTDDNAECYIAGGRFGTVTGTGMEGIGNQTNHTNGSITWVIDHADIGEFYGGSLNAAKPAQGNITTVIKSSWVEEFYGGPKFGDMSAGKTVTTTATDCHFGVFFGAGYGGNSYSRKAPANKIDKLNYDWNTWLSNEYKLEYNSAFDGVGAHFDYQFIPLSDNTINVARIFIFYVKFSLATTHGVTSTLTGCTIERDFYGGGRLGKVNGNVTSTLTDCIVKGSAYGAGYSASLPTIELMSPSGFTVEPNYIGALGLFQPGQFPTTTTYRWEHKDKVNSTATAINTTDHVLYTTEDLGTLGKVIGNALITLRGSTEVFGNVYGGGNEGQVDGDTKVIISE